MTINNVTPEVVDALVKRVERLENAANVNALAKRLARLEDEMMSLGQVKTRSLFADQALLTRTFRAILEQQGIRGTPISAEELQKRFAQLDLEPNEFSRGIAEMRDE